MKNFLQLTLIFCFMLVGCSPNVQTTQTIQYVIGVSQANMREPWRLVLMRELQEEAKKHPEIRLVFTDAIDDSHKQIKDIERLLGYGIDLLIVSPCTVDELTPVVAHVYEKFPVIVMDRAVEGYDYSLFIGPDNDLIGRKAGESVLQMASDGTPCSVLEILGNSFSQASLDRSIGFKNATEKNPNIKITQLTVENDSRDGAEDLVLAYGKQLEQIDIIFAHNDNMALGAYRAASELGYPDIKILGIDGFTGPEGGVELIHQNIIDETITCPTGGREAVQFSLDILNQVSGVPKQVILRSENITLANVDRYEKSLARTIRKPEQTIKVGYAQVGTESGWRLANNNSIREAARDFGIDLTTIDANQSQEKQIESIRTFISQKVDVIVVSPIVASGWDDVLREAKAANIPVLLSDRKIQIEDDELFMTYIGADFIEEGRRAMSWVLENVTSANKKVRILEISGTAGASPTIERKYGFEMLLKQNPDYEIVYSASGDFTLEGGQAVLENYLKTNPLDVDVIFSHNDDMALGALVALKNAGIRPGQDIKIISVDGTKEAVKALATGELNFVVECNPMLGPQLMKAVTDLMSGKELPLRIITDEKVFDQDNAQKALKDRKY